MNKKISLTSLVLVITLILVWQTYNKLHPKKSVEVVKENFEPVGKLPGVKTTYDLSLKMNKDETFNVQAFIDITNTSMDNINSLELYFMPNMFTKENSPGLEHPSKLLINSINVDNSPSTYKLFKDKLTIPLKKNLETNKKIRLSISYSFSLPEEGFRFTKQGENFYLAQWYPMVPTYIEEKGWNKNNYQFKGESYHTTFSNFKIKYEIPKDYTIVTTSENDEFPSKNNNTLSVKDVKEIFIGILKRPSVITKKVDNVQVRLFNFEESIQQEALESAAKSLKYFQSTVGPYPFKQLDIIASDAGMEYPGIVTVDSNGRSNNVIIMTVHEIAHQWFYGVISNDPFYDAWIDEGLASLTTNLFLAGKDEIPNYKLPVKLEPKPSNLPIDQYTQNEYSSYIYGQSSHELLKIFNHYGGRKVMENFLKKYYSTYQYKELDTKEFIRFLKYELGIKEDNFFDRWLLLK
ncbi:M1 family metallopeptidase [Gottfriedia luciferensis]|uniref:M1 family metallopeptidase n=1 Tax=Gottfriedia luciferensis TaxID=178774 RepID=UPI000B44B80D|nr:M1 family metallopeptidase [Gottfriedia luciferensis]